MTPLREDGVGNVDFAQYSSKGVRLLLQALASGSGQQKPWVRPTLRARTLKLGDLLPLTCNAPGVSTCSLILSTLHQAALKLRIKDILGRDDYGFVDISMIKLNTAIRKSILADSEACRVVIRVALCWSFP
jgi:hypothetical protein